MKLRLIGLSLCVGLLVLVGKASPAGELDGYRLVWASFRTGDTEIFTVDLATGDTVNLTKSPRSSERYPSTSFDGRRIAFNSDRDGTHNLYVIDSDGGNIAQLTKVKAPIVAGMPSWTANGEWIYFGLFGGGPPRMCRIHPDGTSFEVIGEGIDPAISPDGKTLVFARDAGHGHILCAMDLDTKETRELTRKPNPYAGVHATWSPDGAWIIYADADGDALELFRCNSKGEQVSQLTHFGKGRASTSPAVSPDGKYISFRLCDEIYWIDRKRTDLAYSERRPDKRPVWAMGIDGSNPHAIELLHYHTTIDGSRAPWTSATR